MTSTKMELAKEYEKLLSKTRDLNLTNETYLRTMRPPSSASVSTQLSTGSNDDDFDEIEQDVIDVSYIDLDDGTSWLFKDDQDQSFSEMDAIRYLHQDNDEFHDARFQTKRLMLNYDIMQVSKTSNNNFVDSRTFTRPKKKMVRPSLESINSAFKYSHNKNPCQEEELVPEQLQETQIESLNAKLKQLSHQFREKTEDALPESNKFSEPLEENMQTLYKNPRLESIIAEQMRKLESDSTKYSEMTNSMESPIVPNFKPQNTLENSMFNSSINFESLNGIDPPSFLMNVSFPSANLISLTTSECEFISTENQPQDLFTSYTSVATNLSEDQNDAIITDNPSETFLTEVQHMSESFSTHLREIDEFERRTMILPRNDVTLVRSETITKSDSITNLPRVKQVENHSETFLTEVQHMSQSFSTHLREIDEIEDRTMIIPNNDANVINNATITKTASKVSSEIVSQNVMNATMVRRPRLSARYQKHNPNETCVVSSSVERLNSSETDKNASFNNTFTKKSANITKISISNPNLSEKGLVEFNQLTSSLDSSSKEVAPKLSKLCRPKMSTDSLDGDTEKIVDATYNAHKNQSTDSLNLSSSFSNMSSNRIAQHTDENEHTELHKITVPKFRSTPIAGKSIKKIWASTESLSPITLPKEPSSDKNRTITKNVRGSLSPVFSKSDAKTLNSVETATNRTIKQVDKTETIYKTTENIHALRDPQIPTMIVKPMEYRRPPTPVNDPQNAAVTNPENKPETKTATIRQPIIKSGLPRPTSGIPRLHSRLPIPRSLRPPSEHKPPAPPVKNNWMDGCY